MIFHSNVDLQGGGTVVWPKSHHQIRALAESDPQKYEYMWMYIPCPHIVRVANMCVVMLIFNYVLSVHNSHGCPGLI